MANGITDENILIQAGLSEEQALVYGSLLEKGPQKASNLSSWTGIKRGLTYKVLEQLEIMGLVEKKGGDGTVATFYPQHPSLLMHTLEGREKELVLAKEMLTFSLGTLSSKYNLITGKPSVQFFEGLLGMQKLYDDILVVKEDILLIQSNKDRSRPEIEEIVSSHIKKQVSAKIHVKAITPFVPDTKEYIEKYDEQNLVTRRVVSIEKYNPEAQIMIYGNKVGFTSFGEILVTTIIDNKEIASTMRATFEGLWSGLEKDHKEILSSIGL